ncbi:MAG: hypothetical protein AAGF14_02450 [Pseudomonadota bacterium]
MHRQDPTAQMLRIGHPDQWIQNFLHGEAVRVMRNLIESGAVDGVAS